MVVRFFFILKLYARLKMQSILFKGLILEYLILKVLNTYYFNVIKIPMTQGHEVRGEMLEGEGCVGEL